MVPGEIALDASVCAVEAGGFVEYEKVGVGGDRLMEDVCGGG
jgi:hypothetical protein